MKLALIGAGVRSPLFVAATLRRASRIGLRELALMDVDGERLELFAALVRQQAREAGSDVRIVTTSDPEEAVADASHVVISIRVGGEPGRVLDERIAFRHGVLGQETTGPGGFAMALRNIPVVLEYAALVERLSPSAWLYCFTNPAGLVTQALRDSGFSRTIGICDGANDAQRAVAEFSSIDYRQLRAEVFGLNHLSWTTRVTHEDVDLLGGLLENSKFRASNSLGLFDRELISLLGMWPNAYLYYFYYAERAVAEMMQRDTTRGEEILEITAQLLSALEAARPDEDPEAALSVFRAYHRRRHATYMATALRDAPTADEADQSARGDDTWGDHDEEGYAGVMLDIVEALESGEPLYTALNVPNDGAIPGMAATDVVEVSCLVDAVGIRPVPVEAVPGHALTLMRSVKEYERLTVEAIEKRSRNHAIQALMSHPLVLSYPRASALVDEYVLAHRAHLNW